MVYLNKSIPYTNRDIGEKFAMIKEGIYVNSQKPWLQHYREEIPPQLEYDEKPLHNYLKKSATEYPNKIAIHFLGKEFTFQYIYDQPSDLQAIYRILGY